MDDRDFNWMNEHEPELFEKYAGKWIAVRDGEVVGVGDTAPEAAEQARKKAPEAHFVLEAIDTSADVIYAAALVTTGPLVRLGLYADNQLGFT